MIQISQLPGHLIRRMHQISVAAFKQEVKAMGYEITPVQFAIMATLEKNPNVDQATLAGLVDYDPVTIGRVLDRLVLDKIIRRKVSKADRRAKTLQLTELGVNTIYTILPAVEKAQKVMLVKLTEEEQLQLRALMSKAINEKVE